MAQRITATADGVTVEEIASQASATGPLTARQRIARLRAAGGPRVETVEIGGEPWHIKRMAWADILRAGMATDRDASGEVVMDSPDTLTSMAVALLHSGLAKSADDLTPYMSLSEAREFVAEPDAAGLVADLVANITRINPDLSPN